MKFGDRLKKILKEKKMTQTELAKRCEMSLGTIAQYACGYRTQPTLETLQKICKVLEVPLNYFSDTDQAPEGVEITNVIMVDLIGTIPAGNPQEAIEEYEKKLPVPVALIQGKGPVYALKVCGDSMAPRITAGDIIVVAKELRCENGDTAVIKIDDQVTLKKIYFRQDIITLIAENKDYPPQVFTRQDNVEIMGKVIFLWSKNF